MRRPAPFWSAFGGSALFVVLIWRQLVHIAHDDVPAGEPGPTRWHDTRTLPAMALRGT